VSWPTVSVVVETWNLDGEPLPLRRLLAALAPQLGDAELVITHACIPPVLRAELAGDRAVTWVPVELTAGYYDHKNAGFAAARGDIVAFIDGDCDPDPDWLAHLIAPIVRDAAQVVAGYTSYRGVLAPIANRLDFPYFAHDRARGTVRNFFANNVAFARRAFMEVGGYPAIPCMFHGQCQVLALLLLAGGIAIHYARTARVIHAWPADARSWLEVRLLRGADTTTLLPYIVAHYAPRAPKLATGRVPALAILAARAVTGVAHALRRGPRVRSLALVAAVTAADSIGCLAGPAVYRAYGVPRPLA
jgi:hypothetical protein